MIIQYQAIFLDVCLLMHYFLSVLQQHAAGYAINVFVFNLQFVPQLKIHYVAM